MSALYRKCEKIKVFPEQRSLSSDEWFELCAVDLHSKKFTWLVDTLTDFIQTCLDQARLASPSCHPNPAVGAVVVSTTGEILGIGHTQTVGKAHAEISALADAARKGHSVVGSTMYVSLEPCSHFGRTGPCAHALVKAGIAKVIASIGDPNPKVSGKGFDILRSAGISVEIGAGADEARALNIGFFSRFIRHRPWVRLKTAISLDGRTALLNGESQWITDDSARQDGHQWRARASAIMTGIGTILKDNPKLDCRNDSVDKQPLLAIIDSQLRTPIDANVFDAKRNVVIYAAHLNHRKQELLEERGALIIYMPDKLTNPLRVDLKAVLSDLAMREINELHVEAGEQLNGAMINQGLVDEYLIYIAPKLIGPGASFAKFAALESLSQSLTLEFISCARVGQDLRLIAREPGRTLF